MHSSASRFHILRLNIILRVYENQSLPIHLHTTVQCKRANSSVEQCSLGVWPASICNTSNKSKVQGGIPASSRASEGSGSLLGWDGIGWDRMG